MNEVHITGLIQTVWNFEGDTYLRVHMDPHRHSVGGRRQDRIAVRVPPHVSARTPLETGRHLSFFGYVEAEANGTVEDDLRRRLRRGGRRGPDAVERLIDDTPATVRRLQAREEIRLVAERIEELPPPPPRTRTQPQPEHTFQRPHRRNGHQRKPRHHPSRNGGRGARPSADGSRACGRGSAGHRGPGRGDGRQRPSRTRRPGAGTGSRPTGSRTRGRCLNGTQGRFPASGGAQRVRQCPTPFPHPPIALADPESPGFGKQGPTGPAEPRATTPLRPPGPGTQGPGGGPPPGTRRPGNPRARGPQGPQKVSAARTETL